MLLFMTDGPTNLLGRETLTDHSVRHWLPQPLEGDSQEAHDYLLLRLQRSYQCHTVALTPLNSDLF